MYPPLIRWFPKVREVLTRARFDIVHLHSNLQGNELWAAGAACAAGVRAIVCTFHCPLGPETVQRRLGMWGMHRLVDVRAIAGSSEIEAQVREHYRLPAATVRRIWNGIDAPRGHVPLPVTTYTPQTPSRLPSCAGSHAKRASIRSSAHWRRWIACCRYAPS
jgi:hypothetical protein